MKDQEEKIIPALYMVASPIGNLEDLSFRALRVLKEVDWIAAEDTRESRKLLHHFGIEKTLHSFHENSNPRAASELALALSKGERGAYLSDAGTPGVSDPGAELVRQCAELGVPTIPVPGASAVVSLVSIAGFKSPRFLFSGFFPRENKERLEWAARARLTGGGQVFFESPHRILACLSFLKVHFPSATLVVGRELTKKFETITRGTCESVAGTLESVEPRGEYALAMELPDSEAQVAPQLSELELRGLLGELVALGLGQKPLVRVAMSHGLAKNHAYALALEVLGK